jgi:hypothetical protein
MASHLPRTFARRRETLKSAESFEEFTRIGSVTIVGRMSVSETRTVACLPEITTPNATSSVPVKGYNE